ncbi:type III-B CRISPR module RAMP protein Cmr4 [Ammonifex thiophilus]|uniref:Type III-B CRISPR module RAMP protein Cmr4 n=1 Tax=Ammonifex thiophilus TaxID=444093 RepID=A0A3D8P1F9_9THEO|nr:type III-B CRISPR module RAMP protein Cmr4 [Ammonifex thiophilus]RDV81261.1 type III-B CRISPR module RAMP protein Cmr4 [Ammonifex thiophilus]
MSLGASKRPFRLFRFLLQSVDPVHVGVGGYRLGRVDLPIARDPATNLPKLPGTGISGAARHYAALRYGKPQCAGQGSEEYGHCGDPECPICYTFGSLRSKKGEEEGATAGTVRIFDARILFFPVYSMLGPVWVTSPQTLRDFGLESVPDIGAGGKVQLLGSSGGESEIKVINFGWLVQEVGGRLEIESLDGDLQVKNLLREALGRIEKCTKHVFLVPDELFGTVVNSNLEVRTSVSIDPETGAAKEGALFTYEAIPRATFFWLDVVENDYRDYRGGFPRTDKKDDGNPLGIEWQSPIDVVTSGIEWFEYLGVGGMSTRGFGRLKKLACREVQV